MRIQKNKKGTLTEQIKSITYSLFSSRCGAESCVACGAVMWRFSASSSCLPLRTPPSRTSGFAQRQKTTLCPDVVSHHHHHNKQSEMTCWKFPGTAPQAPINSASSITHFEPHKINSQPPLPRPSARRSGGGISLRIWTRGILERWNTLLGDHHLTHLASPPAFGVVTR